MDDDGRIRLVGTPNRPWWVGWFEDDGSGDLGCLVCGVTLPKRLARAELHINWHESRLERIPRGDTAR